MWVVIAKKFGLTHGNILRSINKCKTELKNEPKYNLTNNLIEAHYLAGPVNRPRKERKVDITEFGYIISD